MIPEKPSWAAEIIRLAVGPMLRGGSPASRPGIGIAAREELRGYERWILPPPKRMLTAEVFPSTFHLISI